MCDVTARNRMTRDDYEKVKRIVDLAVNSPNKKLAESFIRELDSMHQSLRATIPPNASNIFGELICEVRSASGDVSDKAHWLTFVSRSLYKLESYGVEKDAKDALEEDDE